ncbi:MAG: FAD-dependent oxidoreductase [Clostridia bacterium]|nr:FAD-dependent oxidoreductase [Clostridia bacterium]
MNSIFTHKSHKTDFCVIGGGLSGICAALEAARHGSKVILIQDRPVLGGNSSSEIRMWVRGAGVNFREPGIIMELDLDNIYRNPHMNHHQWDMILYNKIREEENITVLMNCSVCDAKMQNGRILSVTGWQLTTYTWHTVEAEVFADCSGDSILSGPTGAEYMIGREDKTAFGEEIARETADEKHMGMSCLLQARETDHPVEFIPPSWARKITEEFLEGKQHDCVNTRANFWWIEVGGNTGDGISDTEECRDKLLEIVYGVWDHIKNGGDHGAENWELEWVGFLPGKRESRRYKGAYVLTANDLTVGTEFEDTVAYGGWTMDDHNVDGIEAPGYSSTHYPVKVPYPIPYRSLYSSNVPNLFFAGRNISASHMAMSSTRVMATCALMGQAVGCAAALCTKYGVLPSDIYESHLTELQKKLMDNGCYLPGFKREMDPIMEKVKYDLPSEKTEILQNGIERLIIGEENCIEVKQNDSISLKSEVPLSGYDLRIVFDPDYQRTTINPPEITYNPYSQKSHRRLDFKPLSMPASMIKSYTVVATSADGKVTTVADIDGNHSFLALHSLPADTVALTVTFGDTYRDIGKIYACDIVSRER